MPIGPPPVSFADSLVKRYRAAEGVLRSQLTDAIAKGTATQSQYEEYWEAQRLRREAERVAADLDAAIQRDAEDAHQRAKKRGERQAEAELNALRRAGQAYIAEEILYEYTHNDDDVYSGDQDEDDGPGRVSIQRPPVGTPGGRVVPQLGGGGTEIRRGRGLIRGGVSRRELGAISRADPGGQFARDLVARMTPAHRAATRSVDDIYRRVIAQAAQESALGTKTRLEAAQDALDRFARRGITGFVDKAGRAWDLKSYAEMAVRTSTARANVWAGVDRLMAGGIDLVYVSAHVGECDLCGPWSGKILTLSGPDRPSTVTVTSRTDETPHVIEIAGSLDHAMSNGFMHPNCRHSISAYLPGATTLPSTPRGTRSEEYGHTQRLRSLERRVRRAKELEQLAMTDAAKAKARRRVRAAQADIRRHVDSTGVPRQRVREQITRAR